MPHLCHCHKISIPFFPTTSTIPSIAFSYHFSHFLKMSLLLLPSQKFTRRCTYPFFTVKTTWGRPPRPTTDNIHRNGEVKSKEEREHSGRESELHSTNQNLLYKPRILFSLTLLTKDKMNKLLNTLSTISSHAFWP